MDLYDPDRARGPLSVRRGRAQPWRELERGRRRGGRTKLKAAGSKAVLLTGPVESPALRPSSPRSRRSTGLRHVVWSPLGEAPRRPGRQAFGAGRGPGRGSTRPTSSSASAPSSSTVPTTASSATSPRGASPDQTGGVRMSRFIQLEGRLTLTGANADRRLRVRDSHLGAVGASLAHELVVVRQLGPLAADAAVTQRARAVCHRPWPRWGVDARPQGAGRARTNSRPPAGRLVVAGGSASATANGPAIETRGARAQRDARGLRRRPARRGRRAASRAAAAALAALADEMRGGSVDVLIVAGANPVYDARRFEMPGRWRTRSRRSTIVSLSDRLDETTMLADSRARRAIPSSAGATRRCRGPRRGAAAGIQPLFDTRGLLDVLVGVGRRLRRPAGPQGRRCRRRACAAPVPGHRGGRRAARASRFITCARRGPRAWAIEPGHAGLRHGLERRSANRLVAGGPAPAAPTPATRSRPRRWGAAREPTSGARAGARTAALPAPRPGRRTGRQQRLAARAARPGHPHDLGQRAVNRARRFERDAAPERRPHRGRHRQRHGRGAGVCAMPACTTTMLPLSHRPHRVRADWRRHRRQRVPAARRERRADGRSRPPRHPAQGARQPTTRRGSGIRCDRPRRAADRPPTTLGPPSRTTRRPAPSSRRAAPRPGPRTSSRRPGGR